MHIQIIGLCRFSLLSHGAFQDMPDDIEERREKLFDPARLERRMTWFENVTLPTMKAQREQGFTFLVVTSEDLPEPFMSRLRGLLAEFPAAKLMTMPVGPHRDQCAEAIATCLDPSAHRVIQFRLDDDDGVALDFTAQLLWRARGLLRHFRDNEPFGLDFQRGMVLSLQPGGISIKMVHGQFWTPGLAYVLPAGAQKNVMDYFHHRVWRHMNTVGLPNIAMFIRGDHAENDSGQLDRNFELPFKEEVLIKQLRHRFGLDHDRLSAALGAPHMIV